MSAHWKPDCVVLVLNLNEVGFRPGALPAQADAAQFISYQDAAIVQWCGRRRKFPGFGGAFAGAFKHVFWQGPFYTDILRCAIGVHVKA